MVLRRSTTDCTWERHRSRVARSIVAFIACPYRSLVWQKDEGIALKRQKVRKTLAPLTIRASWRLCEGRFRWG